jgi:hypothetical protein
MRTPIVACTLALLTSLAFADLDKKQAGALSRAATQITNNEKSLEGYGDGQRWGHMTERVEGDYARKLAKIREQLEALPADDPGVKAELGRLAAVEAAVAKKVAARNAIQKAGADATAEIEELLKQPAFATDLEQLKTMVSMFERARTYDLDHYHFGRWLDHEDNAEMKAWGEGWVTTQKKFEELRSKYAKAVDATLMRGQAGFAQIKIKELAGKDAVAKFDEFKAAVAAFTAGAPAEIEGDGKLLLEEITRAGGSTNPDAILAPEGKVQVLRNRISNLLSAYRPLAPSDAARTKAEKSAEAGLAAADVATAKLADKIIKANTAPADAYAGKERDAIDALVKKVWKAKFPNEAILAVRIRGEAFERTTKWVPLSNGEMVKQDASRLRLTVVVKGAGNEAYLWAALVTRDHMAADTLSLDWAPRSSKGPMPTQRMLQANLK